MRFVLSSLCFVVGTVLYLGGGMAGAGFMKLGEKIQGKEKQLGRRQAL